MILFANRVGVFKVPYPYQFYRGRISSCKEGREYHGCGEEYTVEKREWGSNIISYIFEAVGKIKWGKGAEFSGEKIKI